MQVILLVALEFVAIACFSFTLNLSKISQCQSLAKLQQEV